MCWAFWRPVAILRRKSFDIKIFSILSTVSIRVLCISLRTKREFSLYKIKWLFFVTHKEYVYCAVWTEYLNKIKVNLNFEGFRSSTHTDTQVFIQDTLHEKILDKTYKAFFPLRASHAVSDYNQQGGKNFIQHSQLYRHRSAYVTWMLIFVQTSITIIQNSEVVSSPISTDLLSISQFIKVLNMKYYIWHQMIGFSENKIQT